MDDWGRHSGAATCKVVANIAANRVEPRVNSRPYAYDISIGTRVFLFL